MDDEGLQQQPEWRRRVTEAMAATTYEQLKALVEGVTGGFDEVSRAFDTLDGRLEHVESETVEARMAFGQEAERARTSFAEHTNAVTQRVEAASDDLVERLAKSTEELSTRFTRVAEETDAKIQELQNVQAEQLAEARTALAESATSIITRVEKALADIARDVQTQVESLRSGVGTFSDEAKTEFERQAAATIAHAEQGRSRDEQLKAAIARLSDDLSGLKNELHTTRDELISAVDGANSRLDTVRAQFGPLLQENLSAAEAHFSDQQGGLREIAQRLDELGSQVSTARSEMDFKSLAVQGESERLANEVLSAMGELRSSLIDRMGDQLQTMASRLAELPSGATTGDVFEIVREALAQQANQAATRWDSLVDHLVKMRAHVLGPDSDDIELVALIRSLEQVLDARDQRIVQMLDEAARALPTKRRKLFLKRAASSLDSAEHRSTRGPSSD